MIIWRPLKLKHNNKMCKGGVIVVLKTKIFEVSAFQIKVMQLVQILKNCTAVFDKNVLSLMIKCKVQGGPKKWISVFKSHKSFKLTRKSAPYIFFNFRWDCLKPVCLLNN